MAAMQRMKVATEKHDKKIFKRGLITPTADKNEGKSPVGPWLLALFIFVVCGSAVFEIVRSIMHA